MRKIWITGIIAILSLAVSACSNITKPVDFRQVIRNSVAELDEIVLERGVVPVTEEEPIETAIPLSFDPSDPDVITPAEFHAVYDAQVDNSKDVVIGYEYLGYADFMRAVAE
ncbi:MAG: hypothetical protein Q8N15_07495, partial [Bacillota bacterium]|nr:hypothetical protein [Bacillota bacterium]